MESVLIAGGTGLIGRTLLGFLKKAGYQVNILTRSISQAESSGYHLWSIHEDIFPEEILANTDHIINLTGANMGEKRWTQKRKNELIKSRVESLDFLHKKIKQTKARVKTLVSASAVGYYGAVTSDTFFDESHTAGHDFLGHTCKQWEEAAFKFEDLKIRVLAIRIPLVLARNGGVLNKLKTPVKFGLSAPLGTGRQYMPWIHIDDLCLIFLKSIKDPTMRGAYNACPENQPTNRIFMKTLSREMKKPFLFPAVPEFLLKFIFGEMAVIVLSGSRISGKKLMDTGIKLKYPSLDIALRELLS